MIQSDDQNPSTTLIPLLFLLSTICVLSGDGALLLLGMIGALLLFSLLVREALRFFNGGSSSFESD